VQAYLNAAGDVLGCSSKVLTLAQAQAQDSAITTVIASCPDGIVSQNTAQTRGIPAYYHQQSSGDGTQLADYDQVAWLSALNTQRFLEIDARSQELIAQGHTYPQGSGQVFSLSPNAQRTWIGMVVGRDALVYPVEVNFLDDSGTIFLQGNAGLTAAGADSDGGVAYRSQVASPTEADITVEHSVGATGSGNESLALRITVTGRAILIEFGTDGAGVSIVPTATQVADLVTADTDASALVAATAQGTGSSTVAAKSATNLVGAEDVVNFYGNAMLTVRAHLDSGTALKEQVKAATTKTEVDAVVDNR